MREPVGSSPTVQPASEGVSLHGSASSIFPRLPERSCDSDIQQGRRFGNADSHERSSTLNDEASVRWGTAKDHTVCASQRRHSRARCALGHFSVIIRSLGKRHALADAAPGDGLLRVMVGGMTVWRWPHPVTGHWSLCGNAYTRKSSGANSTDVVCSTCQLIIYVSLRCWRWRSLTSLSFSPTEPVHVSGDITHVVAQNMTADFVGA